MVLSKMPMTEHSILIANQTTSKVDLSRIRQAARYVLERHSVEPATISIALVDNPTIHALNRQFLDHDYATDVLSFRLSEPPQPLEGEVIVSHPMAEEVAGAMGLSGWDGIAELLLYVIHGTLHLVGFDDKTPAAGERMQAEERAVLQQIGLMHEAAFVGRDTQALPDGQSPEYARRPTGATTAPRRNTSTENSQAAPPGNPMPATGRSNTPGEGDNVL